MKLALKPEEMDAHIQRQATTKTERPKRVLVKKTPATVKLEESRERKRKEHKERQARFLARRNKPPVVKKPKPESAGIGQHVRRGDYYSRWEYHLKHMTLEQLEKYYQLINSRNFEIDDSIRAEAVDVVMREPGDGKCCRCDRCMGISRNIIPSREKETPIVEPESAINPADIDFLPEIGEF